MCTFFVKKPKQSIKKEHFITIIENNPQGFGFVYTTGSKLVIVKSPNPNAERMWKQFCDAERKYPKSHFIGHGRIATGSNLNNENTHPFLVNRKLAMVHNGIIRQFPSTAQKSDTVQYIEQVIRKLPTDFYKNKSIMDMMGRDIVGSKFAFLTLDNKIYVVNEHACVIDGETGILFSNSNYKSTDWLDYGGQKVHKSEFGRKEKKTYKNAYKQSDINFHADSKKCEIKHNRWHDWVMCQDCHEWVDEASYDARYDMCYTCCDEYGLSDSRIKRQKDDLHYCDDCGMNVSSKIVEDWRLCDLCADAYENYIENINNKIV